MKFNEASKEVIKDRREEFIKGDEILLWGDGGLKIFCKNPRAHIDDNYIIDISGEWHRKLK